MRIAACWSLTCCMYWWPTALQPQIEPVSVRESSTSGRARLAASERAGFSSGKGNSTHMGHAPSQHHSPLRCLINTPPPSVVPAATDRLAAAAALSRSKSTPPASASYTGFCISLRLPARSATSVLVLSAIAPQQSRQTHDGCTQ